MPASRVGGDSGLGLANVRGVLKRNEPLALHTSWRVGGPADRYFEPADRADLLAFLASLPREEPLLWLGLGSNLLVRDGGFHGTVIALHGALDELRLEAPPSPPECRVPSAESRLVYAGAGVHCARLAKFAERRQLAGLGFMAGIPGTVGGALAGNAGAWGGETWSVVVAAEVAYRDGRSAWLAAGEFAVGYRRVVWPAGVAGFLGARFAVSADDGHHALATRQSLARRKATQPVGRPSAGSTFRNPPGDHAARLIEAAGLKGARVGGAVVSAQHANFILTDAGASAADVEALIELIRRRVRESSGVELEPEVRIVGQPAHA